MYYFSLDGFEFPEKLDNSKANFRFIFELRYVNDKTMPVTITSVSPGAETFFECDPNKKKDQKGKIDDLDELYYVRKHHGETDDALPEFAMGEVQEWHKLVLMVNAAELIGMRLKVLDVDRKDFWDKFKEVITALVGALLGRATSAAAKPELIAQPVATASEQFQTWLTDKMAGKHKVLFREYIDLKGKKQDDPVDFEGDGYKGIYILKLKMCTSGDDKPTVVADAVRKACKPIDSAALAPPKTKEKR